MIWNQTCNGTVAVDDGFKGGASAAHVAVRKIEPRLQKRIDKRPGPRHLDGGGAGPGQIPCTDSGHLFDQVREIPVKRVLWNAACIGCGLIPVTDRGKRQHGIGQNRLIVRVCAQHALKLDRSFPVVPRQGRAAGSQIGTGQPRFQSHGILRHHGGRQAKADDQRKAGKGLHRILLLNPCQRLGTPVPGRNAGRPIGRPVLRFLSRK